MNREALKQYLPNLPETVVINKDFFWETFQKGLTASFNVVEKAWGAELHIVNKDYCMKYLMMWRGGRLGRHYHKIKSETFIILDGVVEATTGDETQWLFSGDKLDIPVGTEHSLFAKENTVIIEVSTHDSADDSYRLEPKSSYTFLG